jgi:hypothetical protein
VGCPGWLYVFPSIREKRKGEEEEEDMHGRVSGHGEAEGHDNQGIPKRPHLQFKHPVLTLGLLRRPRLAGLAASPPPSPPIAGAIEVGGSNGSMPSGSGDPVGVAAGV